MVKELDLDEIITSDYTRKLVIKCIVIFVIGAILTGAIFYLSIYKNHGTSYAENFRIISDLKSQIFHKSIYIYLFSSFFIIAGIIFISILYSHRIAGPVYRLENFALKISNGNLSTQIKLRQKDAIHSLANELNNLVVKYKELLIQLELKSKDVRNAVLLIEKSINEASSQKLKENIIKVSESIAEIKKMLYDIKL